MANITQRHLPFEGDQEWPRPHGVPGRRGGDGKLPSEADLVTAASPPTEMSSNGMSKGSLAVLNRFRTGPGSRTIATESSSASRGCGDDIGGGPGGDSDEPPLKQRGAWSDDETNE